MPPAFPVLPLQKSALAAVPFVLLEEDMLPGTGGGGVEGGGVDGGGIGAPPEPELLEPVLSLANCEEKRGERGERGLSFAVGGGVLFPLFPTLLSVWLLLLAPLGVRGIDGVGGMEGVRGCVTALIAPSTALSLALVLLGSITKAEPTSGALVAAAGDAIVGGRSAWRAGKLTLGVESNRLAISCTRLFTLLCLSVPAPPPATRPLAPPAEAATDAFSLSDLARLRAS